MNEFAETITELLAQHGLRITTPRKKVFSVLHEAEVPLSPREVFERTEDIDAVSVYRTLATFASIGIAQIVTAGFKQKYELADTFKPHHHHLQCSKCGALVDVSSEHLEKLVDAIAQEHDYVGLHHKFELTGVCRRCQLS